MEKTQCKKAAQMHKNATCHSIIALICHSVPCVAVGNKMFPDVDLTMNIKDKCTGNFLAINDKSAICQIGSIL